MPALLRRSSLGSSSLAKVNMDLRTVPRRPKNLIHCTGLRKRIEGMSNS
jgi:hypothetical protein